MSSLYTRTGGYRAPYRHRIDTNTYVSVQFIWISFRRHGSLKSTFCNRIMEWVKFFVMSFDSGKVIDKVFYCFKSSLFWVFLMFGFLWSTHTAF